MADKLFGEHVKRMTSEEIRLVLENTHIHIDYSPEWYEELRKKTEGVRSLFDPEDTGS